MDVYQFFETHRLAFLVRLWTMATEEQRGYPVRPNRSGNTAREYEFYLQILKMLLMSVLFHVSSDESLFALFFVMSCLSSTVSCLLFIVPISVEVQAQDMLQAGIQGTPFKLPDLVRRASLKKRSAMAADLAEQPSDGDDEHPDVLMTTEELVALRAYLESRMDKKVLSGSKKGITTVRSRYARNLADASDDPTQFDDWTRPENEEDDSSDDEADDENLLAAAGVGQPRQVISLDRVFCPVIQSGKPCKANYKHGNGKSMEKHVLTHCPDGHAVEGQRLWSQFVRDGKVECTSVCSWCI